MAAEPERFGDRVLVNGEIAPVPISHRLMRVPHMLRLWPVFALVPAIYSHVGLHPGVPMVHALLVLAGAACTVVFGVILLSRSASRYGIGFVALARAAFGPRGARPVLMLRWLVGALWGASCALAAGEWIRQLLLAYPGNGTGDYRTLLKMRVPGLPSTRLAALVIAAFLLLLLVPVLRRGMSGVRRWVMLGGATVATTGIGLVILGGIRSRGFGSWLHRSPQWTVLDLAQMFVGVLLVLLPALLSVPDWMRFRRATKSKPAKAWTSIVMVPIAVVLGFIGALLASASYAKRHVVDAVPIPDAAGFGGFDAGAAAVLLTFGGWMATAPALAVYSPALCLTGVLPRRIGYRRAIHLTVGAMLLMLPALEFLAAWGIGIPDVVAMLVPVAAIMLVDEILMRRGRLLLEELYLLKSVYGPAWGRALSPHIAWLLAMLLHPRFVDFISGRSPGGSTRVNEILSVPFPGGLSHDQRFAAFVVASGLTAAVVYAVLGLLERALVKRAGGKRPAKVVDPPKESGAERRPVVSLPNESSRTAPNVTNPFFQYLAEDTSTLVDVSRTAAESDWQQDAEQDIEKTR